MGNLRALWLGFMPHAEGLLWTWTTCGRGGVGPVCNPRQQGWAACQGDLPGLGAQASGVVPAAVGGGPGSCLARGLSLWVHFMGACPPGTVSWQVGWGPPPASCSAHRTSLLSPQLSAASASVSTVAAVSPAQPNCATVPQASRVPAASTVSGAPAKHQGSGCAQGHGVQGGPRTMVAVHHPHPGPCCPPELWGRG